MLRSLPRARQHDSTDCAAACLQAVAKYYGRAVPMSRIRQYAATRDRGTNALDLVEAAERLGFTAKGVRGTSEHLPLIPLPAILLTTREDTQHYVVLYAMKRRKAVIMDPADGRIHRIPPEQLIATWNGVLVLVAPAGPVTDLERKTPRASALWNLVRPNSAGLTNATLASALYTVLGLAPAIYVQKVIDHVVSGGNRNLLNAMSLGMLVIVVVQIAVNIVKGMLVIRTGENVDAQIVRAYYQHLLRLPQAFFDTTQVGQLIARLNDAMKLRVFMMEIAPQILVYVLIIVLSVALLFLYSWRLGLVLTVGMLLQVLVFVVANMANRVTQRRLMETGADLQAELVECLSAQLTIKCLGLESYAAQRIEARFVNFLRSMYATYRTWILTMNGSEFVGRVFMVIMLWIGAGLTLDQVLTPGELVSAFALFMFLNAPVLGLVSMNQVTQDAMIAADRIFDVLDLAPEPDQPHGASARDMQTNDICFEQVAFRYGATGVVFNGLNLTIPSGQVTMVVGESGSGKSTLVLLLQKAYTPNAGRIRLSGTDLQHIKSATLRDIIGVVPQAVDLFAGDVVENIAPGDPEPDANRILDICRTLGMMAFIDRLPQGLSTILGETGTRLSGGERQRLAIARALYRRPSILVFDEATSSLDSLAEAHVHDAIRRLRDTGNTVILVSHRLTTARLADKIVVLGDGSVIEEGRHEELLGRRGRYHELWTQQFAPSMAGTTQTVLSG